MIKHLLIDGSNLFMRAYFVNKQVKKGVNIGAIDATMSIMDSLLKHFNPLNVVIVWDKGKCTKRLEIYPEYKANRSKMDKEEYENLSFQKTQVKKIFSYLPVRQIELENIEADDIIGYLASKLKNRKIIVSNDRDFIQCINSSTSLYFPNIKQLITENNVDKFIGIPLKHFVLYKALRGDSSDNIPSAIPRFGEKRAKKLILESIKTKKLNIDNEYKKYLKRNISLMKINYLLDNKDKKNIITLYKGESHKNINSISLKNTLIELGLNKYARSIRLIVYPYSTLRNF